MAAVVQGMALLDSCHSPEFVLDSASLPIRTALQALLISSKTFYLPHSVCRVFRASIYLMLYWLMSIGKRLTANILLTLSENSRHF